MRGRDQRRMALLDVACGTGRFLRDVRLTWPAMAITGIDLSQSYLGEARRHLAKLRPATLIEGNGETIPLGDATQDIATCIFLFHELPVEARRNVAAETKGTVCRCGVSEDVTLAATVTGANFDSGRNVTSNPLMRGDRKRKRVRTPCAKGDSSMRVASCETIGTGLGHPTRPSTLPTKSRVTVRGMLSRSSSSPSVRSTTHPVRRCWASS